MTKGEQFNDLLQLELEQKLDARDDKRYELKIIYDNIVYTKEAIGQLLGLYYLVFCKRYVEEKTI